MSKSPTVIISCSVTDSNHKSYTIYSKELDIETTIPHRMVEIERRNDKTGLIDQIKIPLWIAKDRGLIDQ